MIENLIDTNKTVQPEKLANVENLTNQVMKILAGKSSNLATLKFISQMRVGKIFDAVFNGVTPEGKGLLSLEGKKIVVELPRAAKFAGQNGTGRATKSHDRPLPRAFLTEGQVIRVRVESPGPRPALKIISPPADKILPHYEEIKTNLTPRGKSIARQQSFGELPQTPEPSKEIPNARVTHVLDSKSVLVEAGGKRFVVPVENTESLKPGSQVSISFVKTEKGVIPTLIEATANITKNVDLDALKAYLPTRMPIAKMANLLTDEILDSPLVQELKIRPDVLTRLRDTLHLLTPREGKIANEGQVRQQVESSGINYEARVRQALESGLPVGNKLAGDLKGLLLELQQSIDKTQAGSSAKAESPMAEFRQTIKFAIDNIELNQLSSQVSKHENQPQVIQIPNPLTPGNKTIQLYVRKESTDDEGNNKKDSHNVAFFLDLSFLGKIKINARIDQEHLSVRFDAENEEVANFINQQANDFQEKMGAHNIETSVECCVDSKVKPVKDSMIELLVSQNTSLVNLKT